MIRQGVLGGLYWCAQLGIFNRDDLKRLVIPNAAFYHKKDLIRFEDKPFKRSPIMSASSEVIEKLNGISN